MIITRLLMIVLGLVAGSFANAWVWRTRQNENGGKLSVVSGRSQCPQCGHQLAAKDLMPVFSWLWLRGRCRYCQGSISAQYPLVEILTAAIFYLSYIYWPAHVRTPEDWLLFSTWLLAGTGLITLAVYDFRWQLLPNRIIYPTLTIAAAGRLADILIFRASIAHGLLDWLLAVIVASGFFWLLFTISNGRWIGYGDVRLGLIVGSLVAGPSYALLAIIIASLIGGAVAVPLLLFGRKHLGEKLAFGPFLITATWIVVIAGDSVLDWYRRLLG